MNLYNKTFISTTLFVLISFSIISCKPYIKDNVDDYEIIDTKERKTISYQHLINSLSKNDIIFLGELHNNSKTHYLQLKIISSLHSQLKSSIKQKQNNKAKQYITKINIAMEMFEQDTQKYLDNYLNGSIDEDNFLLKTRPWSNYKTAYRPIIEYAKKYSISVIAMNAPRFILKRILYKGISALDKLSQKEKEWIAKNINLNNNAYKKYFYDAFPKHSHKINKILLENFAIASLIKDTTMAEAILEKLMENNNKIISINGKFHSDYGIAIPYQIKKINPNYKIAIISFIPRKGNLETYLQENKKIADYIITLN